MKTVLITMLVAAAAYAAAQVPSYPSSRYPGAGSVPQSQSPSRQQPGANTAAASVVPTEVIRVLSSSSVQQALSLTSEELSDLEQISRSISAATTSEDDAFTAASKALSKTQAAQLQQLMVQDLGYGALALSAVRAKLTLTDAQSSQVTALVNIQETAKRAILSQSSNAAAAVNSISQIASLTNGALAKVLTADQDTALHKMASPSGSA